MKSGERTRPESRRASRGQTTIDFAIGISIFLAMVLFIFLFVPGIVAPFTGGAQEETVTVNRVADSLAQGQLGSPSHPNILQTACTVDFFAHASDGTNITECGPDHENLSAFVGISDRQNVNVSVYGNTSATDTGSDILCWDGSDAELVENDESTCDGSLPVLRLAAGDTAPNKSGNAVAAKRVVFLDGTDVTIFVEMW